MAEPGSRRSASIGTAYENLLKLQRERGEKESDPFEGSPASITRKLRDELSDKGLKGFKRGGKVKKTGVYKLHKGEKVVTAKTTRAMASRKPSSAAKVKSRGARK
jgi:hypothetical protein